MKKYLNYLVIFLVSFFVVMICIAVIFYIFNFGIYTPFLSKLNLLCKGGIVLITNLSFFDFNRETLVNTIDAWPFYPISTYFCEFDCAPEFWMTGVEIKDMYNCLIPINYHTFTILYDMDDIWNDFKLDNISLQYYHLIEYYDQSLIYPIYTSHKYLINNFSIEYFRIFITIFFGLFLAFIIFSLSYIIVNQEVDIEKISAYECGFQPFEDARSKFDVRFYLVGILFLIFDLEMMFLFPWALALPSLGFLGFFSMFIFLIILTIGFLFEWKKKALDW